MKQKIIIVEQDKTIKQVLQELQILEDREMFIISVNGMQVQELTTVVKTRDEIRIYPVISGGSDDSSFCYLDKGDTVELGNSYRPIDDELLARKDKLALRAFEYKFLVELEKYNKCGVDVKKLICSENCRECGEKLHIPDNWKNIPLVSRLKYFKVLLLQGIQDGILLCCSCTFKLNNPDE